MRPLPYRTMSQIALWIAVIAPPEVRFSTVCLMYEDRESNNRSAGF